MELEGQMKKNNVKIAKASTKTNFSDFLGAVKVRLSFGRMDYTVEPGAYAVGEPDKNSPVLVTANYKLTFDVVRKNLDELNVWLLVLDTKGVNVWCAAGKGRFGTGEISRQVKKTKLAEIVDHTQLILPQLGAPGTSAHRVKKMTGFDVIYGPVRIEDLKAFLDNNNYATKEMRTVKFPLIERMVLTPLELIMGWKYIVIIASVLFLLHLITGTGTILSSTVPFVGSVFVGAILFPALLPFLPSRYFVVNGWILGILWVLLLIPLFNLSMFLTISYLLFFPPFVAFLAFNFTGSTTFTSPSGVEKEINLFTWPALISFGVGILSTTVTLILF